jgi:hypothetical protein
VFRAPHVVDDRRRDLLQRAEPRHLLEALQRHQQGQQRLRRLGSFPGPPDLVIGRREEHVQHPRRGQPPELRIRRALDRRHPAVPPTPTNQDASTVATTSPPTPGSSPNRNQLESPCIRPGRDGSSAAHCRFSPYLVCPRSSPPLFRSARSGARARTPRTWDPGAFARAGEDWSGTRLPVAAGRLGWGRHGVTRRTVGCGRLLRRRREPDPQHGHDRQQRWCR